MHNFVFHSHHHLCASYASSPGLYPYPCLYVYPFFPSPYLGPYLDLCLCAYLSITKGQYRQTSDYLSVELN